MGDIHLLNLERLNASWLYPYMWGGGKDTAVSTVETMSLLSFLMMEKRLLKVSAVS